LGIRGEDSAGLATAFIPRPDEFGPDRPTASAPAGSWDLAARDLHALADRLG
jgi:hypothetical protein